MPLDTTTLGTPVEVAAIGKELKKLWQADQTRTRATLFNFAIVCQGEAAMAENTELLSDFVRGHAFHALLLGIAPESTESKVQAWINAHCFLPKVGAKHVCCEQVSIFVQGNVKALLPNLLFSQLDYDLPLTLWWRCDCPELVDSEVWRWANRLIFDSQSWSDARKQFAALRRSLGNSHAVLCDLAWTRSLHLRQSLAQLFDTPETASALQSLTRIAITHAPGARTPAMLIVGWLAAQLGWAAHGAPGNHVHFSTGSGDVVCDLTEADGPCISAIELISDTLTISATRPTTANFLHVEIRNKAGNTTKHIMPADSDEMTSVLDQDLASWGRHSVYLKALAAAEPLL